MGEKENKNQLVKSLINWKEEDEKEGKGREANLFEGSEGVGDETILLFHRNLPVYGLLSTTTHRCLAGHGSMRRRTYATAGAAINASGRPTVTLTS